MCKMKCLLFDLPKQRKGSCADGKSQYQMMSQSSEKHSSEGHILDPVGCNKANMRLT